MHLSLAIQLKSTTRKRSAEVISSTIESHQDGLGGEDVDLCEAQKMPPVNCSEFSTNHLLFLLHYL